MKIHNITQHFDAHLFGLCLMNIGLWLILCAFDVGFIILLIGELVIAASILIEVFN